MAVEEIQIVFDESGVIAGLQQMNSSLAETNDAIESTGDAINKAFNPKDVDKYADAIGDVGKEAKKTDKEMDSLSKTTKKTDTSLKSTAAGVGVLGGRFGGLRRQAALLSRGFNVLVANPIILLFTGLVAAGTFLFKMFTSTKEGAEAFAIASAGLSAVLGVIRDVILNVVKGLASFKDKSITDSFKDIGTSIKDNIINRFLGVIELGKATLKAIKAVAELDFDKIKESALDVTQALVQMATGYDKKAQDEFVKGTVDATNALIASAKAAAAAQAAIEAVKNEQRKLSVERAKLNTQLVKARDLAADTNKTLAERLGAIDKISKAETALNNQEIAQQQKLVNALKVKDAINASDEASLQEIAQAEIKLANLRTQSATRLMQFTRQRLALEKETLAKQKEVAAFEADLRASLEKDEKQAAINQLTREKEAADERINNFLISEEKRADLLRQNQERLDVDLVLLAENHAKKLASIKAQAENEELQKALAKVNTEAEIANLELQTQQEIERQKFNLVVQSEESITAFQKQQEEERLRSELQTQQKRLEQIKAFTKDATEEEKKRLDAQISLIKAQLGGIGSTVQQEVEQERAKSGTGLFGLLGFNEDQQKQISAIQGAAQQAVDIVKVGVEERIAALQKEIDFRTGNISELQSEIDQQIELAKLGKAANISELQDQIAEEKKARDKAEKEKEANAKAQFLLDTSLQASNLVTAISSIYASLAALPLGIGVGIASALSGVMLGTFAASKIKAASLVGFQKGGYTGDGAVDEIKGVTHGREFVVDAPTTAALGLTGKSMTQGKKILLGNHISDTNRKITKANRQNKAIERQNVSKNFKDGLKDAILEQNKSLREINRSIKEQPTVIPMPNSNRTMVKTKTSGGNEKVEFFK